MSSQFEYLIKPLSFLQNEALIRKNPELYTLISKYLTIYSRIIKEGQISEVNKKELSEVIDVILKVYPPLSQNADMSLKKVSSELAMIVGSDDERDVVITIKGKWTDNEKDMIITKINEIFSKLENFEIKIDETSHQITDISIEGMGEHSSELFSIEGMGEDRYDEMFDSDNLIEYNITGEDEKTDEEMIEELRKLISDLCDYIKRHIERYNISVIFMYKIDDNKISLNLNGLTKISDMNSIPETLMIINFLITGLRFTDSKIVNLLTKSDTSFGKQEIARIRISTYDEIMNLLDSAAVSTQDREKLALVVGKLIEKINYLISPDTKETCILNVVKLSHNISIGDKNAINTIDELRKKYPSIIHALGL